ncbi:UvrD-helicase domain-containing protein [Candidatus Parcubacteria bacterium]|nr:UvrD-helicase domain-containing protein [Candidatus Parcubacteria bacterium]
MIDDFGLNPEQKEAVLATDGPLLILAGAGAGKTKTITHRILHLIQSGIVPSAILAITFTNKAATEMRDRVYALLKQDKTLNMPISFNERPYVGTFHSLGVHILRENSKLLGLPRHFAIFDKSDSRRAITDAIRDRNLDPKEYEPAKFQTIISREKGTMINRVTYREKVGGEYFGNLVADVWQRYDEILHREKALDFDDLLLKTAELLRDNQTVLEHYGNTWRYIHVDEYQDTNRVQYLIARLLSEKHKNICVVGDSDQNIYSWRGAQIRNILDFEKDFPNAKVIKLEENYRSTQTILTIANRVIEKNKLRKDKTLFTKNVAGEKAVLYEAYGENDEAYFIAKTAERLITAGTEPSNIGVLFRANFQSRALEEAFLKLGVTYQVVGVRFFERKEVKDILSFIRLALNPESLSDLKRVINVPTRGIGKVTLLKILSGKESELTGTIAQKVRSFRILVEKIRTICEKEKPSDIVKEVIRLSGFEHLKNGSDEDIERFENLQELVSLASRYDTLPGSQGLEKFLTDAALASDQDELISAPTGVKLMTVHAAKGLEFDYVFITGLEENLFPHSKSFETISQEEAEEERRLFYVALTRARKKLYLSYAQTRTVYGSRQINLPSEFIFEIDDELIERESNYMDPGEENPPLGRTILFE